MALRIFSTAGRSNGLGDPSRPFPRTIFGLVRQLSARDQVWLSLLSFAVFVLGTAPLELQRRIVNMTVEHSPIRDIALLALAYFGLALTEGAIKLGLNVYRSWVSENAVGSLRRTILDRMAGIEETGIIRQGQGIEVSMILSEVEPIGGFIGSALSEPVLQGGTFLAVFGYMTYLQPGMAGLSLLLFSPQFVLVPLIQRAINRRVKFRTQALREVSTAIVLSGDAALTSTDKAFWIDHVLTLDMQIFKLKFTLNFLMNLLYHVGIAGTLGIGAWYAMSDQIEVGTIVAFVAGLSKINDPWGDVVNWFRDMTAVQVRYRLVVDALASGMVVGQDARPAAAMIAPDP